MKKKMLSMAILVTVICYSVCGCRGGQSTESAGIYDYKTEYVGDNSKVVQIVNGMEYPAGIQYDSIEIQSQTKPYGLTVYVLEDKEVSQNDLFKNAVVTFALIDNLSELKYVNSSTNETIAEFNRDSVDEELEKSGNSSCTEIGESEEALYNYMSE